MLPLLLDLNGQQLLCFPRINADTPDAEPSNNGWSLLQRWVKTINDHGWVNLDTRPRNVITENGIPYVIDYGQVDVAGSDR